MKTSKLIEILKQFEQDKEVRFYNKVSEEFMYIDSIEKVLDLKGITMSVDLNFEHDS